MNRINKYEKKVNEIGIDNNLHITTIYNNKFTYERFSSKIFFGEFTTLNFRGVYNCPNNIIRELNNNYTNISVRGKYRIKLLIVDTTSER